LFIADAQLLLKQQASKNTFYTQSIAASIFHRFVLQIGFNQGQYFYMLI